MHRPITALALACLLAGLAPATAVGVTALSSSVVESYDAGAAHWYVAGGSGTISTVASPKTEGAAALQIAYNFSSSSQLSLAPRRTVDAPELPGLPRRFSLDVNGDGSWNVVYLQVRDATGEIFHYRLGNVSFSGWSTLSVEPGRAVPATTLSGNGDGILDLPIQVYRLILDKNPGGTKTVSTIVVDQLRYDYESWSPLRSSAPVFTPSAGQTTTLKVGPTEAATVALRVTDESGRVRTFAGSAPGGSDVSFGWNGRDDGGTLMGGSVRGRLGLTRGSSTWTYGVPYLAGLPARYENASPASIAGVNSRLTEINTIDRAKVENQARLMEGAWLRMTRESFDWRRLEPTQGWFEWAKFDQAVEVTRAHNVKVVGRLEFSADWASSAPASASASSRPFYPPSNPATFAAYASAVVARYKDRVKVWEIWNEQNSSTFWKPAPSPAAYATLLKAAYAAIKAEDPSATVLFGGTVGFDKAFMDGIVTAGAWGSFDALAIHAYVAPAPEKSMLATWIQNARAYLDTKGTKPLWLTEFGWSTYTGSGSSYIGVSESTQANYTARSYLHGAAQGVAGMFMYELMERGSSSTSKLENYGLVETGGRQKPAYAALRRVAEALDQGTSAGPAAPGAAGRTNIASLDSITGWTASPLGGGSASIAVSSSRHGGTGSMKLSYSFTGTSTGVELKRNLAIAGKPTMVSVWAYGDASANPVYIKLADATGETFQGLVGSLQKGWQRLVLYGDGGDLNWTHSGGDGDGKFDYPMTLKSIFVYRAGIGKLSGTAYFDDVQVEFGPRVRGVVISRRGGENQALYAWASGVAASVPVPGSNAWRIDGSSSTPLTISGGAVSATLGPLPINVLSDVWSSPSSISPNGDGLADVATMRWLAGDPVSYAFQVLDAGGHVVRTVLGGGVADAGIRLSTWDGKLNGSPAPPGAYWLRLAIIGLDGRVSYLMRPVSVQ